MKKSCILRGLLPFGSGRSSTPLVASSSDLGGVHPVALDSNGLSSALGTVVHPIVVAGGTSGSIVTKAGIILNHIVGGISLAAADRVTSCEVLVVLPDFVYSRRLTETALVASDLGVVSGLGAVTREVAELFAAVCVLAKAKNESALRR
jgi:hypothetical protein